MTHILLTHQPLIATQVQQISATLEQTSRKCASIYQLIASQPSDAWRTFAMLQVIGM